MSSWDLLVNRADLDRTKLVATEPAVLEEGQARLGIDAFGFSANNITYAAFGDMIGYWDFFPVRAEDSADRWGRVPVWGFADVVESRCDDVAVGERIYGYFPMSTELVVRPANVRPGSFRDGSTHRAALPAVYNSYTRSSADPGYDEHFENEQMLLRPLFFTSFLIDDFLGDNAVFGARTVVATSASSKTGFGTAHLLSQRDDVYVVGLTSEANVDFVEGLECYDAVLAYDQIGALPRGPAVLIDFAGNAGVVRAVHTFLGDDLKYSATIGGTHWDAEPPEPAAMPGPAPVFFFAPTQIERRTADWGSEGLAQRLSDAWLPFIERVNGWIEVEHGYGPADIEATYLETLGGNARPDVAMVLHPSKG
ncbi:MAG: DUF2855 family protein [Acidimicrobiales bacterium]